jgi:hypothetical protein
MGTHNHDDGTIHNPTSTHGYTPLATPPEDELALLEECGIIEKWIEVWDYIGGIRFRGFLAAKEDKRALFIFFNDDILTHDLKPGYTAHNPMNGNRQEGKLTKCSLMALLELCSVPDFDCAHLVACLDRRLPTNDMRGLRRDLGWVGFEPVTLAEWTDSDDIVSTRWLLLGMEI